MDWMHMGNSEGHDEYGKHMAYADNSVKLIEKESVAVGSFDIPEQLV